MHIQTNDTLSIDILARLLDNIDVLVDFNENAISYSTIGTHSVSSCTFILVTGNEKDCSFAYLSHYPECLEPPEYTPTSTLVYFIDQISSNVSCCLAGKKLPSGQEKSQINALTNLQVFIGGGTKEERDLVRESFTLLNEPNHNFENLFDNALSNFFYQQLKLRATILSSTTLLLSDDEETEEGIDVYLLIAFSPVDNPYEDKELYRETKP